MASGGGNTQKQEEAFPRDRRGYVDRIKEDGIRKELYEKEWKAREKWEQKWGFLKNPKLLWEEEARNRGLPQDIFDRKDNHRKPPSWPEDRKPKFQLLPSEEFPRKSSGIIGWRSAGIQNNLDRLAGPMYTSRKLSMNPPLSQDEPDLRHQHYIYLG